MVREPPQAHGRQCLVLAVLLVCAAQSVRAHGTLLSPRSRSFLAYLTENFYLSHGLNAGGNKAMGGFGALTWPASQLQTLCGDAPGEGRWDVPGPVQATYAAGQVVAIDVVMAVNHLGRFEFQLCDLDAKPADASSRCVKLTRADGKGSQWYLPFLAAGWTGGNNGVDAPAYNDGSFSWYRMPEVLAEQGCKGQRFCNQYKDQVVYRTSWQLPANFTCAHCKLQWVWMTASSCWPPCAPEHAGEPTCPNVQVFPECGQPGTTYPEHFFGCADVRVAARPDVTLESRGISTEAADGGATPLWEPGVTLHSGRVGTPAPYQMFSTVPMTLAAAAAAASAPRPAAAAAPVTSVAVASAAPAAVEGRAAVASDAPAAASDTRAAAAQLPHGRLAMARRHTGRGAAASIQSLRGVRRAAAAAAKGPPPKVAV